MIPGIPVPDDTRRPFADVTFNARFDRYVKLRHPVYTTILILRHFFLSRAEMTRVSSKGY